MSGGNLSADCRASAGNLVKECQFQRLRQRHAEAHIALGLIEQ